MKEFLEYLLKNLVDQPDAVEVQCTEGEEGILAQMRVAKEDIGKIVGRNGATIKALRHLVMTICVRLGHRIRLELVE